MYVKNKVCIVMTLEFYENRIKKKRGIIKMKFNELMKQARNQQNLTQQNVADIINVTVNTIQNWEKDEYTKPSYEFIPLIAGLYKIDAELIIKSLVDDTMPKAEKKENIYPFMPVEMFDFKLTKEEQEFLGVLYLRDRETDGVFIKQSCHNPYVTSNILDRLVEKKLIHLYSKERESKYSDEVNKYGNITELGITVSKIIKKNPESLFDAKYLEFSDMYELFKYFDLEKKIYRGTTDNKEHFYNILKEEKHQCLYKCVNYRNSEYCIDDKYTLDEFEKYVLNDYYTLADMEATDEEYLKEKSEYQNKKKYYDEHKNDIEMLKSLTNDDNINYLKEPIFKIKTSKFIIPTQLGREFGDYIKTYK